MRDPDRLLERLGDAETSAEKLLHLLQHMKEQGEVDSVCDQKEEAERAMQLGTHVLTALQNILAEAYAETPNAEQTYNPQGALCVDACYVTPHILRCIMPVMPITKSRAAAKGYTALYRRDLQDKLLRHQPTVFQPYARAYVIYIHYDTTDVKQAAYYDNDNLAIKSLLDTVLPLVCLDDAAPLCDNLYFYVDDPDYQPHTELWVVEHHHLAQWASLHPKLPMLADLSEFYDSKED